VVIIISIVTVLKFRRLVSGIEDTRNAYRILVEKPLKIAPW
jgi:hypothetical protein